VRIPDVFDGFAADVLARFGSVASTRLGQDYFLIKTATPEAIQQSEAAKFARWNLPMDHTWPCNAKKMDGFIEKAAQTLWTKFGTRNPQGIFIGVAKILDDKYARAIYKWLARPVVDDDLGQRILQEMAASTALLGYT
jgi:hypothetical protein